MTEKRFSTNGYKIYDTFHDGIHWLVNEVEADEIVDVMNNLDTKARERSKALSKLQKENEKLKSEYRVLYTQHQDLKKFVENNFDEYMTQKKLTREIEQLKQKLNAFKPIVFQDTNKGTILLYTKDYEDLK